ncbi:MAG: segregation/condensation protein A [Eubacterium sp.]|nr:segregation/condensation protein A [Eubacterium sp.]
MSGYAVSLEKFEGPLDLLIHLIQKNKIDIYDIPIAEITNQYLAHIDKWRELDMEVASEFIVMAAKLLEIKSQMLLPRSKPEEESEEDLKEKLVKQLIEYKIFKNISDYLEKREAVELGVVYKDPEYIPEITTATEIELSPEDLEKTFARIFSFYNDDITFKDYSQEIVREVYTVEEKIAFINAQFETGHRQELHFSELFYRRVGRSEVVVTFMAILEMYKINAVRLYQDRVFQEIIIKRKVEE